MTTVTTTDLIWKSWPHLCRVQHPTVTITVGKTTTSMLGQCWRKTKTTSVLIRPRRHPKICQGCGRDLLQQAHCIIARRLLLPLLLVPVRLTLLLLALLVQLRNPGLPDLRRMANFSLRRMARRNMILRQIPPFVVTLAGLWRRAAGVTLWPTSHPRRMLLLVESSLLTIPASLPTWICPLSNRLNTRSERIHNVNLIQ